MNRRRFLQLAGGTAATSLLSASIARAAEIAPARRTGTVRDIEHVVVLMQENRSFDHFFGTLRGVRGYGDPRPVTLQSGKPVWYQSDGKRDILPFRPDTDNLGLKFIQDLPHGWNDTHAAWNGGNYDKWVPAKGSTTMAYLTRDDIPFHYALADAFTVCDAYHCSFMGSTDPNRYYLWSGYTGNDGQGGGPVLGNDEAGYSWTTYPERLEKAGVSWKIYQDVGDGLTAAGGWGWIQDAYRGNYGDNSLLYFKQYQNAQPGEPLYEKARTGTNAKQGQSFFDVLARDVKANQLPQVSWIVAPEAFCEHPNWPVNYGAYYISQVLDALTANPDVWSKTALLITYDENDGFFDHVVPPYPVAGQSTVDTKNELYAGSAAHPAGVYGLGQRVPMLVVSPWSKGGWVCSETFDHTSVIRFLETRFGVAEPNITPWRRTVCGDLTSAFDFGRTDSTVPKLPDTSGYLPPDHNRHPDYIPAVPAKQSVPRQESGQRPARPLAYDLAADAVQIASKLQVTFASRGSLGAGFYVTTPGGAPQTYTVGTGRTLVGSLPAPATGYDYTVHGPNGFFRRFAGAVSGVEVVASNDRTGEVRLELINGTAKPVRLTLRNGYDKGAASVRVVQPGAHTTATFGGGDSHNWYDVTVTSDHDPKFVRRVAGHVEDGRPSASDPATITV